MKMHPLLDDPDAVLISRTPVSEPVNKADFERGAQQVLAALRIEIEPGENAVLKPNVTAGEVRENGDTGIGTHAHFIGGLTKYLHAHGARPDGVYVLEDPRNNNTETPRTWVHTGYPEMAAETGAILREPYRFNLVERRVPNPLVYPVRRVPKLAVAPNSVLINVPKMKTHNLGITTLCMKNLQGADNNFDRHYCGSGSGELRWSDPLVHSEMERLAKRARAAGTRAWLPRWMHELWQQNLARRLTDICQVLVPRLNVVEGVVARDGTGFNQGTNFPLGLVVAGTNVVAVDTVASYLMGFNPARIVYLRIAGDAGLGTNDLRKIAVYETQGNDVVPCRDLAAWRANPPFRVISNVLGEDEEGGYAR